MNITLDSIPPATRARVRRSVRVAMAVLVGLVFVGPVSRAVAQTVDPPRAVVAGTVFQDSDGDGVRNGTERGIAGVSVSDGVRIVRTDSAGSYRLEVDVERRITDLVFMTQPAGFRLPTDQFMTPRFYRDLGQLSDGDQRTADFPLQADPRSRRATFSFANIADPHINPQLPAQLQEINSTSRELGFIQVSGDLTNGATDAEFQQYKDATARSSLPVWPAVGNHEYFSRAGTTYPARIDNYRRHVGPEWYSFDYGNRHFLVLENNGQAPFDEQLAWARADLAANAGDKRLVVLTHQPLNIPFGSPAQYDAYGDLLERYNAELILVGHAHSNDAEPHSTFAATAKHVQTNSSDYTVDQTPRGFRYVHMRGSDFDNPFRLYGVTRSLTITNPVPGAQVPAAALDEVQVNAYHTADEVRAVRYRLDGDGPWHHLKPSGQMTWFGDWPGRKPGIGRHTLEVQAHGPDGTRWSQSATFTVTTRPPAVPRAGADWPQHQGNERHSGVAAGRIGPDLDLAWIYRTPGTFLTGSPVIVDGVVYAGTRDEDGVGTSAVHAVDLATGRRLWQFPTDSSVNKTVAVHDGIVYAQSMRSRLYAIDAATGRQLWVRQPGPAPEPFNQRTYGFYGVTVAGGKVFWVHQDRFGAGSRGVISALDPKTGTTIWESPMVSNGMAGGTAVVDGGRVFVGNGGDNGGKVLAYDLTTGALLWTSSNSLNGTGSGVPTVADGRVFVGEDNAMVARDAQTGADLWLHRSEGPSLHSNDATPSTAAVSGNTVYMGFTDGRVKALRADTGQVLWNRQLPGRLDFGGVFSSPVVSGDVVYVGSNNGHMYALDRLTGEQRWAYQTGAWNATGLAASGNTLVFGSWDGNLYAFTDAG